MGIGRPETPESFIRACEVFVYTTNLISEEGQTKETVLKDENEGEKGKHEPKDEEDWVPTVRKAVESANRDDGWAHLGAVGQYVRDVDPAFDPRTFGYKKFLSLVASRPDLFKTHESKKKSGPTTIEVKLTS